MHVHQSELFPVFLSICMSIVNLFLAVVQWMVPGPQQDEHWKCGVNNKQKIVLRNNLINWSNQKKSRAESPPAN